MQLRYLIISLSILFSPLAFAEKKNHYSSLIDTSKISHMLLMFFFIITLIFISAFLFKKLKLFNKFKNEHLKVITSMPLSTKDRLIIVATNQEQLLLGLSPGRITYLCHLNNHETLHKGNEDTSPTPIGIKQKGQAND